MNLALTLDREAAARPNAAAPAAAGRLLFIDNVRAAMIVLVLGMHAAVTYSPFGSWYWRAHPRLTLAETAFFGTFQAVLQGFFMALLFFVAGVFAERSLEHKGARAFLAGRLWRLGAPTLLFMFVIGPPTEYFLARSWTGSGFQRQYAGYLASGQFLSGTGPLWFCAALILFCLGFVVWRGLRPSRPPAPAPAPAPGLAGLLGFVLLMSATTWLVRLVQPVGTAVLNLQLCYFPSYILMFAAGVAASRRGWLEALTARPATAIGAGLAGLALLAWPVLLAAGGALAGRTAAYQGGAHWQAAAMALWESVVCVGASLLALGLFSRGVARQGRLARHMSANAFAVYVLHPPVLIGLALLLRGLAVEPVAKFALLWMLAAIASFGLVAPAARRIPGLKAILA